MLYIATINNIYEGKSYYGNSTVFYVKEKMDFHVIQNPEFPILPGDEVAISSYKKWSKGGKRYYYVFDIIKSDGDYRKLPKINKDNTKIMSFLGYKKAGNGIAIMVGFAQGLITPRSIFFEEYLLRPLRYFGVEDLPRFNGDIMSFLGDLIDASEHLIGENLKVKLRYRRNFVILEYGDFIIPI